MKLHKLAIALAATAALVACGGGDDSSPAAGGSTGGADPVMPGVSTGGETPGTLQLTVFTPQLTTSASAGTVVYDTATKRGSISFKVGTADQTVSTTDGYDNVVNFAGFATKGTIRANGNLFMLCPAPADSYKSTHLVLSSNLKRVTDVSALRGKSFTQRHCGGTDNTLTFNNDGSVTSSDGGSATAAEVLAMNSDAGWNWTDGAASGNIKSMTYSFTNSAGQTRYYFVIQDKEDTFTQLVLGEQQ